jgi:hypothetical protein
MGNYRDEAVQKILFTVLEGMEGTVTGLSQRDLEVPAMLSRVEIISWKGQMKVFVYGKFHKKTIIHLYNVYKDKESEGKNLPYGAMIVHIADVKARGMLELLGFVGEEPAKAGEEVSPQQIKDTGCLALGQKISTGILDLLSSGGYPKNMILGKPQIIEESEDILVPYNKAAEYIYELSYEVREGEELLIDLVFPRPK